MLEQDPLAMNSWHRERLLEALEAYRKAVGEAPLLRKWFDPGNQTATLNPVSGNPDCPNSDAAASGSKAHQPNPMPFVLSTDEVDRHGDVIATAGWNLDSYRKNPVFLWTHDYARPVIGRAVDTWLEPHRLPARVDFAPTAFPKRYRACTKLATNGAYPWGSSRLGLRSGEMKKREPSWGFASWSKNF